MCSDSMHHPVLPSSRDTRNKLLKVKTTENANFEIVVRTDLYDSPRNS